MHNIKLIPENEKRIYQVLRKYSSIELQDIDRMFQVLKSNKIPCSKEEASRVAEKIRQELFANEMKENPSFEDEIQQEINTVSTSVTVSREKEKGAAMLTTDSKKEKKKKGRKKPKNRVKKIKSQGLSKSKVSKRKLTPVDKKREWAVKQWLEEHDLPVVRVRDRMLDKFGSATDWNTLKECRDKAWNKLMSTSGSAAQSMALPISDLPDKVRQRVMSYVMGENNPPPGVQVNVSVHLVT